MSVHQETNCTVYDINDLHLHQIEMVCLEDLVPPNHRYKLLRKAINLDKIKATTFPTYNNKLTSKYSLDQLLCCLSLQIIEDFSYLKLESALQENNAAKWFCGFALREVTPNYKELKSIRRRFGIDLLVKLFSLLYDQLKAKGYHMELLSSIDPNSLMILNRRWRKRDKDIVDKMFLQN